MPQVNSNDIPRNESSAGISRTAQGTSSGRRPVPQGSHAGNTPVFRSPAAFIAVLLIAAFFVARVLPTSNVISSIGSSTRSAFSRAQESLAKMKPSSGGNRALEKRAVAQWTPDSSVSRPEKRVKKTGYQNGNRKKKHKTKRAARYATTERAATAEENIPMDNLVHDLRNSFKQGRWE